MCGIFGYSGPRSARETLLEGLKRLEYRGYDSAGIAVHTPNGVGLVRSLGKIVELRNRTLENPVDGRSGIAHTRWATHGKPSEANSHPHRDNASKVFVVHNGIIENHMELRAQLEARGAVFRSETDTETIAHLLASLYEGDLQAAFLKMIGLIRGAYALAVIHEDEPGRILVGRYGSPLVIGSAKGECFVSSDVSALLPFTRDVVYLEDGEIGEVRAGEFRILDATLEEVSKSAETVDWDVTQAERGGYKHFMLKEIFEQPTTIANTIRGRITLDTGNAKLGGIEKVEDELRRIEKLRIVVCGTARHAGLIGQYLIEELSGIATEVDFASEFRYRKTVWDDRTAVLAISQSGETADTLAAIREANEKGALTLGVVNTVGSSLSRETDAGIYNHIGPEISVASTKAFTSQLVVVALLAIKLGRQRQLSLIEGRRLLEEIENLPGKVEKTLEANEWIREIASHYVDAASFGFLGRKYNYPMALEGALKLKEVSYIHAEGFPSGELKHGSIALIEPDFPSFFFLPKDSVYSKNLSNMEEIRSRKGPIIAVTTEGCLEVDRLADHVIQTPETLEQLTPILTSIPAQLFAYHVADLKGLDVDQPRNLAKSVTVE